MQRSLQSFCAVLPLLFLLAAGCSMGSNKAFSWLKPNAASPNAPIALAEPNAEASAVGKGDASIASGAIANVASGNLDSGDAALADAEKTNTAKTVAAKLGAGLGAGLVVPASASKRLTPIQRDLNEFQSFPFDIEMADVSGRPIRLQDLRGKVIIVDLWGTWCGPCRRVIPHLVKLQKTHSQDLQVIGLCNERTADTRAATRSLTGAIEEFGINYPCILIDDKTTRKVPNFSGYPTMLFIDRTGKVRMSTVGVKPEAYWDSLVAELIAS